MDIITSERQVSMSSNRARDGEAADPLRPYEARACAPAGPLPLVEPVFKEADRLIDLPRILDLLTDMGGQFYREITRLFGVESARRVRACEAALDLKELPRLEAEAHALRGSAATVGALALARLAGEIEDAAAARNLTTLPTAVARLPRLVQASVAALALYVTNAAD